MAKRLAVVSVVTPNDKRIVDLVDEIDIWADDVVWLSEMLHHLGMREDPELDKIAEGVGVVAKIVSDKIADIKDHVHQIYNLTGGESPVRRVAGEQQ